MTGTEGVCEALTAMLRARTGWDEAPGLYFIYREDGQIRLSPRSVMPDVIWAGVPTHALAAISRLMQKDTSLLSAGAPPELLGAVFRCEAFAVMEPKDDPVAAVQLVDARRARKLHEHPDRVEQRCAYAVTRDGAQYMASQVRGEKAITARKAASGGDGPMTGLIPDSLARIVQAFSTGLN